MADETYLTPEGAEKLRRELDNLINVKRPQLALKLKEAVAQGDLKENADYHDAKEQQGFMEGRIKELETLLRSAKIIDHDGSSDEVRLGSKVTIREEGSEEDEVYTIVGSAEANPREGKISHESPIGGALLGRKQDDRITVSTPSGDVIFRIHQIK